MIPKPLIGAKALGNWVTMEQINFNSGNIAKLD